MISLTITKNKNFPLTLFVTVLVSCHLSVAQKTTENQDVNENSATEWSIPQTEVFKGGPDKDGIPSLENPPLLAADEVSPILKDTDLILGYKNGNDIRAYPIIILDRHEIINDKIGDVALAVTYCPLTGTGIGWSRSVDGKETTFGVSGLLYHTNLIAYDRSTDSNWSQILGESVNGSLSGEKAELIPFVETDWSIWKAMFPDTKIVDVDTGYSRSYGDYPYGDYKTNNDSFFFPTPKDNRLPSKERVHAVIDGDTAKVYRFSDFKGEKLIADSVKGKDYLVVGNPNFIVSFTLDTEQNAMVFEYVFNGTGEALLKDGTGDQWNVFGEVIVGNAQPLKASSSFMGYWFSIAANYRTAIYEE